MNNQQVRGLSLNVPKLQKLANKLNLFYDNNCHFLCGNRNGYDLYIQNPTGLLKPTVVMSIKNNDGKVDLDEIERFIKAEQLTMKCLYKDHCLRLTLDKRLVFVNIKEEVVEQLNTFLDRFTLLLSESGYKDCCQNCGNEDADFRLINEGKFILCDNCYNIASLLADNITTKFDRQESNFNLGIVGAICGATVGALFIVIFDQNDYSMSLAGLLLAVLTSNSYKLLAKRNSRKGLYFCLMLMLLVAYFTHRLSWSITLAEYYSTTTFNFFINFIKYMTEGYVNNTYYLTTLLTLFAFIIIGSGPMIRDVSFNCRRRYTFNAKKE